MYIEVKKTFEGMRGSRPQYWKIGQTFLISKKKIIKIARPSASRTLNSHTFPSSVLNFYMVIKAMDHIVRLTVN